MRAIMIIVLVMVLVCVSFAQMPDVAVQTQRVAVNIKLHRPPLSADQTATKNAYVAKWCGRMSPENRACIEDAVTLFLQMGVFHVPGDMDRHPRDIFLQYQETTEMHNPKKVDWWVDIPVAPKCELPVFHSAGPAPEVPLLKLEGAEAPCTNMIKERKVGVAVGVETLEATPLKLEGAEAPCTNMIKQNETFVLCDVFGGTIRMPYQAGAVAPRVEARGAQMYERPGKDEYLPIGNVWAGHSHEGPCRKDGTCGDGSPPVKPGTGDGGGPGNGEVDNGLGAPGGYTRPGTTAPPETPAWWGPTSPPTHGSGPAIPDPGTSPARPAWSGSAAPAP